MSPPGTTVPTSVRTAQDAMDCMSYEPNALFFSSPMTKAMTQTGFELHRVIRVVPQDMYPALRALVREGVHREMVGGEPMYEKKKHPAEDDHISKVTP